MPIRESTSKDVPEILAIINDAARAYRGVIPDDRWHEPYMPAEELAQEIAAGVSFWVAEDDGRITGVMGMQDKGDVSLVRHAYVSSTAQRSGVGTRLLRHVEALVDKPVLIGTWAAASWAIGFYQRNGFTVVSLEEKDRLLRTYWSIPARQVETSVVLANTRWIEKRDHAGDELLEREAALRAAQLAGDVRALDDLIDDALVFTGPDGRMYSKQDDLAAHRSGAIRITRLDPSDEHVQRFDVVAVVHVRMEMAGTFNGAPFAGAFRYLRVWCRRPGGWRIVAGQVSAISS